MKHGADDILFSWEVDEYIERERSNDWFWTVGLILLVAIIISLVTKNFIFAIFLLVSGFSLSVFLFRKPKRLTVSITEKGIRIEHNFYAFKDIKQFWVEPEDGGQNGIRQVFFLLNRVVIPELSIPLEDTDPDKLRSFLLRKVPEGEIKESSANQIMEALGF